jgi:purine-binding chemotaxis protein CheW
MGENDLDKGQRRAFDWESARKQITKASAALEGIGEIEPELMQRIWAQRAAQLAKPPIQEKEGGKIELALLQLGCEVYGVDVQYVREIGPAVQITRVPRVPAWVTGVANLRGHILSVLDLRRFFDLAPIEAEDKDLITPFPDLVVVETPAMEVALLADDVLAIEPFSISQIQDIADTVRGIGSEYVSGVITRDDGAPVAVLDLPALLADERLIIQEEIV